MSEQPNRLDALDPHFRQWLEVSRPPAAAQNAPPTVEQMRTGFKTLLSHFQGTLQDDVSIHDLHLPSRDAARNIDCRLYHPAQQQHSLPVVVFAHGGGWVVGDLDTHNGLCHDLARQSGCAVLAVDYRLSPEHHFPSALEDVIDVVKLLPSLAREQALDSERVLLCGDSAGASIIAAACLQLRDESAGPAISAQCLIYPALGASMDLPSYQENADIPGFSAQELMFFFTAYIGSPDTLPDVLAAPLTVEELSALPPTYISVAEFDTLRDDGRAYAERLEAANVRTILREERGLGHAWMWVRHGSPVAQAGFASICHFLRTEAQLLDSPGG